MKYTQRIDNALKLSAKLHQGQSRKDADKTPFSMHPVAVMTIVANYTSDEDVLVAALLHDVLEDVKLPYPQKEEMLRTQFGARVLDIVRGVSEDKDPMEAKDEKVGWKERKQKYLDTLAASSEESVLVSAADKIHNLMSMSSSLQVEGESFWQRFNSPSDIKLWFYEECLKVVQSKTKSPIAQELAEKIEEVRAFIHE
jgi:(p)ppGpp synthase/HD superfamily hydrolase